VRAILARRHLSVEQRRQVVADALRDQPERSNADHAAALGVDDHTVADVRDELEATSEIPTLDRRVGRDGKSRPAFMVEQALRDRIRKALLAGPERSNRAVAATVDCDDKTVAAVRDELVVYGEIPQLGPQLGGRPATKTKPAPTILARNPAETGRAQAALQTLDDDGGGGEDHPRSVGRRLPGGLDG